jgi:hypothetical protein
LGSVRLALTIAALAQLGLDVPNDVAAIWRLWERRPYTRGNSIRTVDQDTKDFEAGAFAGGMIGSGLAGGFSSRSCPTEHFRTHTAETMSRRAFEDLLADIARTE